MRWRRASAGKAASKCRPAARRGFYLIVAAATLVGLGATLTPFDPIRMLFWSAVVNGIVTVPLMAAMMLVVANRKIMGKFAASPALMIFGWCATALMAVVVAAMLATSLGT
jgi:Mn2+/Fe2+ NRAMP family transporter